MRSDRVDGSGATLQAVTETGAAFRRTMRLNGDHRPARTAANAKNVLLPRLRFEVARDVAVVIAQGSHYDLTVTDLPVAFRRCSVSAQDGYVAATDQEPTTVSILTSET